MKYSPKIREEELKNRVAADFFHKYDCAGIIKDIDFAVKAKGTGYLLWAEAKKNATDIIAMLAQLVLTIGKARTFNEVLPPKFLGCFDCEKIAFVPYAEIQGIFYQSDFNWEVAPSKRETKEFRQIYAQVNSIINNQDEHKTYRFDFEKDEKDLKLFILKNFMPSGEISKIKIDDNNFIPIYHKWLEAVKPTIDVNWDEAKKSGIIDGDFYLADLLSNENKTLKDKLFVLLKTDYYELDRKLDGSGFFNSKRADFKDRQRAYSQFWVIYERPPEWKYWDYIVKRRDLLVPPDVRERKGAFYTPPQWVAKAHEYLAKTFGENWQDEYYVWDNSAGSGNLLAGLANKDNLWASTLDKQDVAVMHDRIENGGMNLWPENVFQFDFLNDDFDKLPPKLREIIDDPAKREKLIFLINPPYGEAATARTRTRNEVQNKAGVSESKTNNRFKDILGISIREKYIQFFARIQDDVPGCKMAAFVKPKYICGSTMRNFRSFWKAKYLNGFATPATTHDNCTGEYPICLFIWDLERKENFPEKVPCDIFNEKEEFEGVKTFHSSDDKTIIDWLISTRNRSNEKNIGFIRSIGSDFQNNDASFIVNNKKQFPHPRGSEITDKNIIEVSIYFAVRHCIEHNWINDNDQYFFPKQEWESDIEFQNDCIAFTLFNSYNKIKIREGTNHWIPFTEAEVGCKSQFESRFMSGFLKGRGLGDSKFPASSGVPALPAGCAAVGGAVKCAFSPEAVAVMDAGRELWRYYHKQPKVNVNAAFYDIREYFQGSKSGKMNTKSSDETYNELIGSLRAALKALAKKIEPKVYEHGFLKT